MKKQTIYYFYFLVSFMHMADLYAQEEKEVPVNPINCSKEELLSFFPQPVIEFVLVQAHLSQKEAEHIAKELSQKNGDLLKLAEQKAVEMNADPLQSSSYKEKVSKIYQETLYEVFANNLKAHGMNDDHQIRALLEEMRVIQSKLFVDCIRNLEVASSID